MKIVYLAYPTGGVLEYIKKISDNMPEEAEQYGIFSKEYLQDNAVPVKKMTSLKKAFIVDMKKDPGCISRWFIGRKIKKILKEINPDIIYIHGVTAGLYGIKAVKTAKNSTYIYNPQGWEFKDKTRDERKVAKMVDYVICSSHEGRVLAKENGVVSKNDFIVIENGIDFDEYDKIHEDVFKREEMRKQIREELNIEEYQKAIAVLGKVSNQKDPKTFLKAIHICMKKGYNVKAIYIGDGNTELKTELLQYAERNNILDKIEITGWVEDVPENLLGMDVGVLPSLYEGFGISLVEYMGAKIPVITSDAEGLPNIILDGEYGKVFEKENEEDLAEKIIDTLNDINNKSLKLDEAYNYAKENYSIEKMVDEHKRVFNKMID